MGSSWPRNMYSFEYHCSLFTSQNLLACQPMYQKASQYHSGALLPRVSPFAPRAGRYWWDGSARCQAARSKAGSQGTGSGLRRRLKNPEQEAYGSSTSSSLLVGPRLVSRERAPVPHHTHTQEERDTEQDDRGQPQEKAQGVEDGHGPSQTQQQDDDFIADGTAHRKERE